MSRRDKNIWIKFENKSNRVKGLAFHPKRPWILASLHDGVIQLWDYRMEALIEKYEEHDGPVRGIHFHPSQPLFVSGGDDYKIKVWNYQRCLFNLLGHLDYIRTVQFHQEYPWILSASDDQTIRIWNWQSRTCLTVLTGHNHYVMCAQFHPKDDLILSASLDQTVRVWDFSGLRKKNVSIAGADYGGTSTSSQQDLLFGGTDVVVKHVLEGHTRGVNWAAFHPTTSLIVSGADDREVKLWRMNDAKAWDLDTMRGHANNVSCVIFHPKKELIISNSEDKSIRVWDMSKQSSVQVFRRDNDRYWILDAHPTQNLLAAGHDSGLLVFKLNRERPAFDVLGPRLYFYSKLFVYELDLKKGDNTPKPILTTRTAQEGRRSQSSLPPRTLSYNYSNQSQHCILLCWDQDNSYELYAFSKTDISRDVVHSPVRGFGKCAVFVSRNRFAVLDRQRQIYLKNLKNETKRKLTLPEKANPSHIWSGGIGKLLIRTTQGMLLYDIQALKILAEFNGQSRHPIKYTSWSQNGKYVAMWSKTHIFLCDSKLQELGSITETSRIKSAIWDNAGVLVYTTHTHVKYLLPNGDGGVVRTLEFPIYLTAVHADGAYYIDREDRTAKVTIDPTEYLFKMALMENRKREVLRIIESKKLVGESIIAYLQKKGFPDLALKFVEEDAIKFPLALECGDIGTALECAKRLEKKECWHKLGSEALRQGNHEVVETALQKTKNFDRLSFLYLITGNKDKLNKMLHISTLRKDSMSRFHNSLYLGNIQERVKVLSESGQLALAILTAKTHGLKEEAAALEEQLRTQQEQAKLPMPDLTPSSEAKLFVPPAPILKATSWPLLDVQKGFFQDLDRDTGDDTKASLPDRPVSPDLKTRGGDDGDDGDDPTASPPADPDEPADPMKWPGLDLGLDLGDDATAGDATADTVDDDDMPSYGKSATEKWGNTSTLAADLIASGQFDQAMHNLNRQIGVINFAPMKNLFMGIVNSCHAAVPLMPGNSAYFSPLTREGKEDVALPNTGIKLENCVDELKSAYNAFTGGKFKVATDHFLNILATLPLVILEKKSQESELHELLDNCREYITAIRLETLRRETTDPVRQASLSAYFTQCKIQQVHLMLGLRVAIKCAYTIENFKTTAGFCRRVIDAITSTPSVNANKIFDIKQIKQALKTCEKKNTDAKDIDYDESKVFTLCCETFTPIYKGKGEVKCPYCQSSYKGENEGSLCKTCQLSKIGAQATGLKNFAS